MGHVQRTRVFRVQIVAALVWGPEMCHFGYDEKAVRRVAAACCGLAFYPNDGNPGFVTRPDRS